MNEKSLIGHLNTYAAKKLGVQPSQIFLTDVLCENEEPQLDLKALAAWFSDHPNGASIQEIMDKYVVEAFAYDFIDDAMLTTVVISHDAWEAAAPVAA